MTRTADGHRGRTRTSAGADPEVADLRDESAYSGRCGVSVNRYRTAASALNSGGACCRATCSRIFWMMSGRVTSAITRSRPPQSGRSTDQSQILCAVAPSTSSAQSVLHGRRDKLHPTPAPERVQPCAVVEFCCDGFGTTALRCLALGARMPWYRTRLPRGRGTNAASRARNSIGSNTKWVVPSRYGVFS